MVFSKHLLAGLESHTKIFIRDLIMCLVHGPTIPSCIFVFLGITSTGISVNMIIHKLFECGLSTLWKIWDKIFIQDGFFFFLSPNKYGQVIQYIFVSPRKISPIASQRLKNFRNPPVLSYLPLTSLNFHITV